MSFSFRHGAIALALLLAAACELQPPDTRPAPARPTSRRAIASPTPSPAPLIARSTPTPAPATPAPTPQVAMSFLIGKVKFDARYLLEAAGGRLVSNNGSSVIAVDGSPLISDKGLGLIGNNGGGLIGNNGGGYRLLDASAIAVGEVLPVSGMAVQAYSLSAGTAFGPPQLTDESGQFKLSVPASEASNVLVVAMARAGDPRLRYDLISAVSAAPTLDEDTTLVTRYMRRSFAARFLQILTVDDFEKTAALITTGTTLPEFLKTSLINALKVLRDEAKAAGIDGMTAETQAALAWRTTDAVFARSALEAVQLSRTTSPLWEGPDEPAIPALNAIMKHIREKSAEKLAGDADFFKAQPYMVEANAGREPPYAILRPSDVGDFLVSEYLVRNEHGVFPKLASVMQSVGAMQREGSTLSEYQRLTAATDALAAAIGQAIMLDTNGTRAAAIAAIREFSSSAP